MQRKELDLTILIGNTDEPFASCNEVITFYNQVVSNTKQLTYEIVASGQIFLVIQSKFLQMAMRISQ
jgi:hypothetical protein